MKSKISMRIRYWAWTTVWAALVFASIVLMLIGLWRRIFFGYTAIPEFVEDLRVGNQFILAGSLASLLAAALTLVQKYPRWVSVCVAAPAVLIGGLALMGPPNLAPHLVAFFVLPAAFAGMLGGILRSGVTPR
jgi:hypothetical protein